MVAPSTPADVDPDDPATVENPVTGERFRFHTPPENPAGDPLVFDIWAPPAMTPLGTHVHPRQVETFTVNAGSVELVRGDTVETLTDGETVTVPPGTPHTWSTAGDETLHLTIRIEPGLQTEAFLRDLATLAHRGEVGDDGVPSPLQIAALFDAYGFDLLYLASPPLPVQKIVFGVLAPLARGLGYRANPV